MKSQKGAALLVTVWVITLGVVLTGTALLSSRGEAVRARQLAQRVQGKHAADSGIHLAVLKLLQDRKAPQERAHHTYVVGDFSVAVEVIDQSGKIDLNHADERLMAAYFRATGLPPQRAQNLASAIAQRRAKASVTSHVYESVEQLRLFEGVDARVMDCIAPGLTVLTGGTVPDVRYAVAPVAVALREFSTVAASNPIPSVVAGEQMPEGRLYELRAVASGAGGAITRTAVLRLTGEPGEPYMVHSWTSTPANTDLCKDLSANAET